MTILKEVNQILEDFHQIVNTGTGLEFDRSKGIKVGVDLGTSSIVLVVLDGENRPIFGAFEYADVVKDGLVVNYQRCAEIVRKLKVQAEEALGCEIKSASGAIPPGTVGNNKHVVGHVIESADMMQDQLIDEPSAAALILGIKKGAVVDVGGGTTGISVLQKGKPIFTADEPTGGTHMTLVLAGHHRIPVEEAELLKRDPAKAKENFVIVRPVLEKMASISHRLLNSYNSSPIILVGGAAFFEGSEKIFSRYLEKEVYKPLVPQYVTPLGIAMSSQIQPL